MTNLTHVTTLLSSLPLPHHIISLTLSGFQFSIYIYISFSTSPLLFPLRLSLSVCVCICHFMYYSTIARVHKELELHPFLCRKWMPSEVIRTTFLAVEAVLFGLFTAIMAGDQVSGSNGGF